MKEYHVFMTRGHGTKQSHMQSHETRTGSPKSVSSARLPSHSAASGTTLFQKSLLLLLITSAASHTQNPPTRSRYSHKRFPSTPPVSQSVQRPGISERLFYTFGPVSQPCGSPLDFSGTFGIRRSVPLSEGSCGGLRLRLQFCSQ